MREKRLYMSPGSDVVYRDFDEAVKQETASAQPGETVIIEEWSVRNNRDFFPHPYDVVDQIFDGLGNEIDSEQWHRAACAAAGSEIVDTIETAMDLWAERIDFWVPDQKLSEVRYLSVEGTEEEEGEGS